MNLFFRMFLIGWLARRRPPLTPVEESRVWFRVLPNDLDVFGHMNNSRYLAIMDLGRLDLITRMGLSRFMLTRRWMPLVAASRLRHRRSLNLLQRYELVTRMVYWDDKWFYLEQRFERAGELHAVGWIKGLIRGPQGNIATAEVLTAVGYRGARPDMPRSLALWLDLEQAK